MAYLVFQLDKLDIEIKAVRALSLKARSEQLELSS
jgi:hypothetical protein